MDILFIVLEYLLPALVGILAILLIIGVKKLLDKMGIDRNEATDALVEKYVKVAVNYAEVAGRKYLQETNQKLPSDNKKAKAVKVAMDQLKKAGLVKVGEEIVSAKIESWLEESGKNPGIPDPNSPGESA